MTESRPSRSLFTGQARLFNWAMLAGLVLLFVALDRLTKWLVVHNLAVNQAWAPVPALSRVFTITHVQNTGIAFGQFHGLGWIFMLVNVIVLFGVVFYYPRIPVKQWPLRLAAALILAGDLGNIIDRIGTIVRAMDQVGTVWAALSRAYVTDMFDFKIWPVFNVADMCVVAGVLLAGWMTWRADRAEARQERGREPVLPTDPAG
jgi:signal peptidase II